MDDESSLVISKWTWAAALALFALVFLAAIYAFSTYRPVKVGIEDNKPLPLSDSKLKLGPSPYSYPPPKSAFVPFNGEKAKPQLKPRTPEKRVTHKKDGSRREVRAQQIKDMFPMGNVAKSAPAPRPKPQGRSQPREVFQSFNCAGRQWQSTGQMAAAGQLDLIPSSCRLGGRSLYALAGSGESPRVLFMQSLNDPSRYVIYR